MDSYTIYNNNPTNRAGEVLRANSLSYFSALDMEPASL